jgi:serine/threonine-protein kinase SRPK3
LADPVPDIKCDNILFNAVGSDSEVERLLAAEPLVVEGEHALDGKRYPVLRSQPLPNKFKWSTPPHLAELITVTLVDLGQGAPPLSEHMVLGLSYACM